VDPAKKRELARRYTEMLPAPEEIAQDWGEFLIDVVDPLGVWGRPGLSPRDRSLITIAALTAIYRPPELRLHIRRGLENGLTRAEISEVIMHMAIYAGFPGSVEGMAIAKEIFDEKR
jgi:alkylhydroperoxidase/carboxymuconolactone decarboxylase family protein YurZ